MSVTCNHCQRSAELSDTFCFYCGTRIRRRTIVADDNYLPIPGVVGQPDLRIRKRRRRPWYRRLRPVAFSVLIAILIIGAMLLKPSVPNVGAVGSLSSTASSIVLNIVRSNTVGAHRVHDATGTAMMQVDGQLLAFPPSRDVA